MTIAIVFDTETTGLLLPSCADLDKQPKIIEFGAVRVEKGKVVDEMDFLCHPGEPISAEITKITGIRNEDLEGKLPFANWIEELDSFFSGAKHFIAHNVEFDGTMLKNEYARAGKKIEFPSLVCTVQEFGHLAKGSKKLKDLYEAATGHPFQQSHRALDDVRALITVLDAFGFWETL